MMMNVVFYVCILFPVIRVKSELFQFLKGFIFKLFGYGGVNARFHQEDVCLVDLPIIRFQDLYNERHRSVDRMCFICSVDYQKDDVLSQLGRCGHVYHSDCVGKLLHQKQTCCPFCRSPVFSGPSPVTCSSF
ncbi:RING-H2 finger protein ATL18-like [Cynara cardunculus var. scolymus]|uniref:RING-H2 finger protein ATL18-like n=1 Tax=Cynara cardunculus var. scolymus TaxID=59895 RepID=UPI000D6287EF|nr:RING-H2 finger protein ATL18-like [Cynara cardunculus var. scolymus]